METTIDATLASGKVEPEDVQELEELILHAKQPRVRAYLEGALEKWRRTLAANAAAPSAPPAEPIPAPPKRLPDAAPSPTATETFVPISSFGWDQDGYAGSWVSVYITSGMDGVGEKRGNVTCKFTPSSFDLVIRDLNGKNYRLYKNNLDKDIVPEESKVRPRLELGRPARPVLTTGRPDLGSGRLRSALSRRIASQSSSRKSLASLGPTTGSTSRASGRKQPPPRTTPPRASWT